MEAAPYTHHTPWGTTQTFQYSPLLQLHLCPGAIPSQTLGCLWIVNLPKYRSSTMRSKRELKAAMRSSESCSARTSIPWGVADFPEEGGVSH
jgi:hypothetical protein